MFFLKVSPPNFNIYQWIFPAIIIVVISFIPPTSILLYFIFNYVYVLGLYFIYLFMYLFGCVGSFLKNKFIIFLFLAVLGLHCCARASSSCGKQGLLFVAVRGLLTEVASLVAEHGL